MGDLGLQLLYLTEDLGAVGSKHGGVGRDRDDAGCGVVGTAIQFPWPPAADNAAIVVEHLLHLVHPGLEFGDAQVNMFVLVVAFFVAGDGERGGIELVEPLLVGVDPVC